MKETQAEKRERVLRSGVLKIQRDGGDWRVLARKLNISNPHARHLWKRVLDSVAKETKRHDCRSSRAGTESSSTATVTKQQRG
jgi:hypothetical protein